VANRWKGQDVLADFMRGVSIVLSAQQWSVTHFIEAATINKTR
jgi:hypothetical protein